MNIKKFFKKIYSMKNHKHFTLIELLVVIGIIGLIAAIVIIQVNSARLKARDSQRRADLHSVQMAVDAYASKNSGKYPQTFDQGKTVVFRNSFENPTFWVPNPIPPFVPDYISVLPKDPKSSTNDPQYAYQYASDSTTYKLEATMESDTGKKWADEDGGNNNNIYEIFTSSISLAWTAPLPRSTCNTNWYGLASGMGETASRVNTLTVYNNELIAGGSFTTAGGVLANRIAKWDGSSWSTLGSGMNDTVFTLTTWDSDGPGGQPEVLVAGGSFTTAGGVP